jgi:hypothetical protein
MKGYYYILKGHEPVEVEDIIEWGEFFKDTNARILARTFITSKIWVSTVFLGLNHNWGCGPPILFETMIFGGQFDEDYQTRAFTWDESLQQHARAISFVEKHIRHRINKRKKQTQRFTEKWNIYKP